MDRQSPAGQPASLRASSAQCLPLYLLLLGANPAPFTLPPPTPAHQPAGQVVERLPPRDVVDQQCSCCTPVVATRDGAEGLLARRVPYLGRVFVWMGGLLMHSAVSGHCRVTAMPSVATASGNHLQLDLLAIDIDHARPKLHT